MQVLLIDIDSAKPNLALKKIEKYHKDKGDEIIWNSPLMLNIVDKIYVSCLYTWNKKQATQYKRYNAMIGGTGYDLHKTLPKEIDEVKPKINLGFTTRGCIRNCGFCVVPEKEGKLRAVHDIYDIWDGETKDVVLLDNNILGLKDHFFKITEQIKKENLRVDFNQGLDCRLVDKEIAKRLANTSHWKEYRFSFDSLEVENDVKKTIKLLKKYGINRSIWYVLVGFNTTFEEDLYRVRLLKKFKQTPYIQRYNYCKDKRYKALSQWANQPHMFHTKTFDEFLEYRGKEIYKHYFKGSQENTLEVE